MARRVMQVLATGRPIGAVDFDGKTLKLEGQAAQILGYLRDLVGDDVKFGRDLMDDGWMNQAVQLGPLEQEPSAIRSSAPGEPHRYTHEPDGPDAEGSMEDSDEAKARRSRQMALLDTRAAGHDVTPGHDQLHHWWTKGPGLARWIGSPHQYTTLHAELVKATKGKLPPGEIDRMAASWVHEVTGFWPGSDMHRVLEGGKPRGNRIGRG